MGLHLPNSSLNNKPNFDPALRLCLLCNPSSNFCPLVIEPKRLTYSSSESPNKQPRGIMERETVKPQKAAVGTRAGFKQDDGDLTTSGDGIMEYE